MNGIETIILRNVGQCLFLEFVQKPNIEDVEPKPIEKSKPKRKHTGGYFNNDVYTQLKVLRSEACMATQDILEEGLNPNLG